MQFKSLALIFTATLAFAATPALTQGTANTADPSMSTPVPTDRDRDDDDFPWGLLGLAGLAGLLGRKRNDDDHRNSNINRP